MPHAVSVLRAARLAEAARPAPSPGPCCGGCRLVATHCLCAWRPTAATRAAVCLLMADAEPLKPTNTGWLVADCIADTFAFRWSRTSPDPALLALLADPAWDACVVFPGEYADPARVVTAVRPVATAGAGLARRPLFVLLDGTWSQARKMFTHSPCLNALPVLSLAPAGGSRYRLRRSRRDDHFCTSEVAAHCLRLAGDAAAGDLLDAYLDVFTHHALQARHRLPVAWDSAAHRRLREQALAAARRA